MYAYIQHLVFQLQFISNLQLHSMSMPCFLSDCGTERFCSTSLCAGKACTADGQLSRVVTPDTLAMFAPGTVRITTEPSFREIYIGTLRHYIPPDYTSSVTFSVRAIESVRQICHIVSLC